MRNFILIGEKSVVSNINIENSDNTIKMHLRDSYIKYVKITSISSPCPFLYQVNNNFNCIFMIGTSMG